MLVVLDLDVVDLVDLVVVSVLVDLVLDNLSRMDSKWLIGLPYFWSTSTSTRVDADLNRQCVVLQCQTVHFVVDVGVEFSCFRQLVCNLACRHHHWQHWYCVVKILFAGHKHQHVMILVWLVWLVWCVYHT